MFKYENHFSSNLKQLRKKYGYDQPKLAKLLNKGVSTVSTWEQGKSAPSIDTLLDIAKLFHIDLNELVSIDMLNRTDNTDSNTQFRATIIKYSTFAFVFSYFFNYLSPMQSAELDNNEENAKRKKENIREEFIGKLTSAQKDVFSFCLGNGYLNSTIDPTVLVSDYITKNMRESDFYNFCINMTSNIEDMNNQSLMDRNEQNLLYIDANEEKKTMSFRIGSDYWLINGTDSTTRLIPADTYIDRKALF